MSFKQTGGSCTNIDIVARGALFWLAQKTGGIGSIQDQLPFQVLLAREGRTQLIHDEH